MPEPDTLIGRRIARYELLDKVGGGGMGAVYRARDLELIMQELLKSSETVVLRLLRDRPAV